MLAVRWAVGVLPDSAGRAISTLIGLVFYAVDAAHRRLAIRQLRTRFRRSKLNAWRSRATFAHFGRLLVALLKFSTLDADGIRERVVKATSGSARRSRAARACCCSPDAGWELQGIARPLALPPMSVLARPLDSPYLHTLLERTRRFTGNRHLPPRRSPAHLRALTPTNAWPPRSTSTFSRSTRLPWVLQPAGGDDIRAGHPGAADRCTRHSGVRLALAGGRYRMITNTKIQPPSDSPRSVRELTQRCADVLR